MKRLNEAGSHLLALLLGLVVVGVVGFAGYTVAHRSKAADTTTATASASHAVPASIKSNADLTAAAAALDNSQAQVNSSLNDGQLNNDLNDLL